MRIFALNKGAWVIALAVFFAIGVSIIHRAVDVGLASLCPNGLLVMYRARVVVSLDKLVCLFEVRPVASFVAEAPYNNRRVVLVYLYIVVVALKVRLFIKRILCESFIAVSHSVRFYVRLSRYVKAVLVAQFIPARVVGVMAGSHGVQVVLFHYLDVLNHSLYRNYVSAVGIHFVTVCAFYQDRFAVHAKL